MSIRLKLIFTYILTVLISVFIVVMLLFSMMGKMVSSIVEVFVENSSVEEVTYEVVDLLVELRHAQEYSEMDLIDASFIQTIDKRLQFFNSGLVVMYKDDYINTSLYPTDPEFYKNLVYQNYSHTNYDRISNTTSDTVAKSTTSDEPMRFTYKGDDYFYFNTLYNVNDEDVIYFFIVKIDQFNPTNMKYARGIFIFVAILVVLLIAPIILIIQKDLIRPLRELEKGSKHISEGNLDFQLSTKSHNEVGRVVFSYEKMRQELKKSIQKQVKYENNRKELISSISHDLKTPITSIKGYVEGILDGVANTDEKKERYLHVIHQKSLDMDRLIDDLFLFSKLDLHKMPFEFTQIHLPSYVQEMVEQLALDYQEEGKVLYEMDDVSQTKANVSIDEAQIKRVITNLVQNSMKYNSQSDKQVIIKVRNEDAQVILSVKDNGIGMSEEELNHAFDMFYRSDQSRNTNTGGSGLGLAIVKHIVLEHQATIKAKSMPDKGTTIQIYFQK